MSARETTSQGAAPAAPVEDAFHTAIWDTANQYRTVELAASEGRELAYRILDIVGWDTNGSLAYEARRWLDRYGRNLGRERAVLERALADDPRGFEPEGYGFADADYQQEIPEGVLVAITAVDPGDEEGCGASWTIRDRFGRSEVVPAGSVVCLDGYEPEETSR